MKDCPQPAPGKGFSLVFLGGLLSSSNLSDEVMKKLKLNHQKNAGQIIKKLKSIEVVYPSHLLRIGRSQNG